MAVWKDVTLMARKPLEPATAGKGMSEYGLYEFVMLIEPAEEGTVMSSNVSNVAAQLRGGAGGTGGAGGSVGGGGGAGGEPWQMLS